MRRGVLILYLALATLAGPWYCCCAASLLRTAPALVAGAVEPPTEEDAEALCPCCRAARPADASPHLSAAPGACHCGEHRPPAVTSASPVSPLDLTASALGSPADVALFAAAIPPSPNDELAFRPRVCPLVSLFSVLRC
jgi:hypothetical protein